MSGHSHAEIQDQVRKYMVVGGMLWVLTVVTVAISYLHLSIVPAVALALAVAITKGALVALIFMHLIDEKKAIYYTLALTAMFFFMLMWVPNGWDQGLIKTDSVYSKVPIPPTGVHHGDEHGGGGHDDDNGHGHDKEGAQH